MLPVLPMLPVANVANSQLGIGYWNWQHFHIGNILKSALCVLMIAFSARAENAYTNHAGNVASGVVVALDARTATISNAMARSRKRAEKGLCSKEESDAFCAKSAAALKSYLDKEVKEGTITPAERKALGM